MVKGRPFITTTSSTSTPPSSTTSTTTPPSPANPSTTSSPPTSPLTTHNTSRPPVKRPHPKPTPPSGSFGQNGMTPAYTQDQIPIDVALVREEDNTFVGDGSGIMYLQDQIIILMALAKGRSRVVTGPLTLHTETAIHVAELITKARFEVVEVEDADEHGSNVQEKPRYIISCDGIGLISLPSYELNT
ncbi:hypothetical protein HK102_005931 [Quaeritorhiza haematococci]|nr:hypothetical protein HK102_005931 [Quaeritorhiza haematococci]